MVLYARYVAAYVGKALESTQIREQRSASHLPPLRLSLVNPQAPFYIPGTSETGLMQLVLHTSSRGEDLCHLEFIDYSSPNSGSRESIQLSRSDLAVLQQGLAKLQQWSRKAYEEKVRKIFTKTAACFPIGSCGQPRGGSFAQLVFQIYEDGSTGGQILVSKGRYQQPYNFSLESVRSLRAHTKVALDTLNARTR
jgi:hypothetical protein